jgi:WXXGXW repeat (2 copies)
MRVLHVVLCFPLALLALTIPATAFAGVFVSVTIAPPALPVYEQPTCPGDGYIWTPGYWAYGPYGYYWVPGTWVVAPEVGLLWTPGYWGWSDGVFIWHAGYWGPHIGFYGGVNYGYGYFGSGYEGGYWRGRQFFYNRTINNVTITNVHVYNRTVINNVTVNRVSYNGGPGGIHSRATHEQLMATHDRHFQPTSLQRQHEHAARDNRAFLASENHGRPPIAATARPGEFRSARVVTGPSRRGDYARTKGGSVPRPQNSSPRYSERNVPRQEMHADHVANTEYNAAPRDGGAHPSAYRPENNRSQENVSRPERGEHSNRDHEQRPRL